MNEFLRLKTIKNKKKPVFFHGALMELSYSEGVRILRRKNLELNTKDFGEKIGVSGRTVEDYEQGRCEPSRAVLMLMEKLI